MCKWSSIMYYVFTSKGAVQPRCRYMKKTWRYTFHKVIHGFFAFECRQQYKAPYDKFSPFRTIAYTSVNDSADVHIQRCVRRMSYWFVLFLLRIEYEIQDKAILNGFLSQCGSLRSIFIRVLYVQDFNYTAHIHIYISKILFKKLYIWNFL